MKDMDIKLYRMKVISGKEETAREWVAFVKEHKEEGARILKEEKAYFEAYFTSTEEDGMYVYMFFAADDVNFSNSTAGESTKEVDIKHFEYMRSCIQMEGSSIIDCEFYMDNLEDIGRI